MKNDETIGIFPIKFFFIAKKWRNLLEPFKSMLRFDIFYETIIYKSATHFNLCSLALKNDFRSYILVLETPIKIFEDSKMIFNAQADTSRDEKWMPALIIKFKL